VKWLVYIHVLSASVWVGGHLVLCIAILPQALKTHNPKGIQQFERNFEAVGLAALLIQVITGIWMASRYVPFEAWLSLGSQHHRLLWIKLALLLATLSVAIHARIFVLPKVSSANLSGLALHIVLVTLFAVAFTWVGLGFRMGV
jgi:uncharacterized membrane protein